MFVSVQHKITGWVDLYPDAEKLEVTETNINISKGNAYLYRAIDKDAIYAVSYSRKYWQILDKKE